MPTDNLPPPPPGTQYLQLDMLKIQDLWQRLSEIKGMFDDASKDKPGLFVANLQRPDSLWLERLDGNGILYVLDIRRNLSATAHFVYWDKKLTGREDFTRECLRWVVERLNLQKINVYLPYFATAAQRFAKRLGFVEEGRIRRWAYADGKLYDIIVLGMTQEEVFTDGPDTDTE